MTQPRGNEPNPFQRPVPGGEGQQPQWNPGQPAQWGQAPAFGQGHFPQASQWAAPQASAGQYPPPQGQQPYAPQPQYGQTQYGQGQYQPAQPQYGQTQYGQGQYQPAQPQAQQPQYQQPQYQQPQYQQPQYQQPQYQQPPYQQPQYFANQQAPAQLSWDQAPGPYASVPAFYPPPPRRRNPLATLLKVVLVLMALAFAGLLLLGYLVSRTIESIPVPQPTGVSVPYPTSTSGAPTGNPTWLPSDQASVQPASEMPEASASQPYENDAYQAPAPDSNPPGLPAPETYEEATQLLKDNPLYNAAVPRPVRCEMAPVDLTTASDTELEKHLNDMMGCLMRVWEPPLKQAGFEAVRPSVTVYTQAISTKCGKLPTRNAVYCGADQQVYYARNLYEVVPKGLSRSRFITESVVAHEFGHAVQARSGILLSEAAWAQKSSKATDMELNRRLEVQADCFAGMFLGSIAQSTSMTTGELGNVPQLFYNFGDDVGSGNPNYVGDHGRGKNRKAWATTGLASTSVGRCNSFAAPASTVR